MGPAPCSLPLLSRALRPLLEQHLVQLRAADLGPRLAYIFLNATIFNLKVGVSQIVTG